MSAQQLVPGWLPGSQTAQLSGTTALIVDPDVRSLDWVKRVLSGGGATVIGLASVDNAIRYLADAAELPTVVISGPGMSSSEKLQLIASIRNRLELSPHELPAIAFSTVQDTDGVRPNWMHMYQAHVTGLDDERQLCGAMARLVMSD